MRTRNLRKNQIGLVSVTVTLVIMIIVTLIVSSFALIVRREQRRALDRQLSMQAFYAAEAGIADAQAAMSDANFPLDDSVEDCTGGNSFLEKVNAKNPTGSSNLQYNNAVAENVQYSCVLINREIQNWNTTSANPEEGAFIVPIETDDSIDSLRISWQNKSGTPNFVTDYNRPQGTTGSLPTPMLRVTIFSGAIPLTRIGLKNSAHTMFLAPIGDATNPGTTGTIGYVGTGSQTAPEQGAFVPGRCNSGNIVGADVGGKPGTGKYYCNIDITGLSDNKYYVVIQPLYGSAAIDIQGFGTSGRSVLRNSQAEIDVTGKAADVLRRVRVRVPIGEALRLSDFSGIFPDAAVSTTDSICKLWERTDTTATTRTSCPPAP